MSCSLFSLLGQNALLHAALRCDVKVQRVFFLWCRWTKWWKKWVLLWTFSFPVYPRKCSYPQYPCMVVFLWYMLVNVQIVPWILWGMICVLGCDGCVFFFEIFWTSGVLTVNFRDSIPRPMGCRENMIKIDIRDVSPHHLILLVDSYFSIKVTGNVVFFCRTSWCQLLLLCVGSGMHSMLRYYQLDLRQTDGATVPPIYSCSAFKPEFCSLLFPWCLFGGIKENAASKWPRKSGFNVNFSYIGQTNIKHTTNKPAWPFWKDTQAGPTAHLLVGKRRSSAICPPSEIS